MEAGRREEKMFSWVNAKRVMMMETDFSEDLFDVRVWCSATEIRAR